MRKSAENNTPVVIVGGGPVGIALAIDLGLRGIRSIVVERHDEPQPIPKGQNLTQRTMELFHFWGAEDELRAVRTIPHDYGIGGMTSYGTLLSGYSYDWLQRELVRPFYFTDNERLPQYATRLSCAGGLRRSQPLNFFTVGPAQRSIRMKPASTSTSSTTAELVARSVQITW